MYAGAASGAVTIGLALLLVLMSQSPEPTKADRPDPPEPVRERADAAIPAPQAVVRLPPPPEPPRTVSAASAAPSPAPPIPTPQRPALKPRSADVQTETAKIAALKPRPPLVPEPEPQPEAAKRAPANGTARDSAVVSRETMTEGRALLKMLEAGKGPVIEIAWPASAAGRARLYALLSACHGMQTALLADKSGIFTATGTPGAARQINRDAVSGFLRRPSGVLTGAERSAIRRIKVYHGMHFGEPVRLFPRSVDAAMLGGIGGIVGAGYLRHKTIRARYRLSGDRVSIVDIRADGETRPGGIVIPRSRRCR